MPVGQIVGRMNEVRPVPRRDRHGRGVRRSRRRSWRSSSRSMRDSTSATRRRPADSRSRTPSSVTGRSTRVVVPGSSRTPRTFVSDVPWYTPSSRHPPTVMTHDRVRQARRLGLPDRVVRSGHARGSDGRCLGCDGHGWDCGRAAVMGRLRTPRCAINVCGDLPRACQGARRSGLRRCRLAQSPDHPIGISHVIFDSVPSGARRLGLGLDVIIGIHRSNADDDVAARRHRRGRAERRHARGNRGAASCSRLRRAGAAGDLHLGAGRPRSGALRTKTRASADVDAARDRIPGRPEAEAFRATYDGSWRRASWEPLDARDRGVPDRLDSPANREDDRVLAIGCSGHRRPRQAGPAPGDRRWRSCSPRTTPVRRESPRFGGREVNTPATASWPRSTGRPARSAACRRSRRWSARSGSRRPGRSAHG